jgi:glycopeptide antibiotics resistance protein
MKISRINLFRLALIALLGFIAFTSTSLAGKAGDNSFAFLFGHLRSIRLVGMMHFTAEKSVHFILFFVLALLLLNMMPASKSRTPRILLLALLVGISSELLQFQFPGRDPAVRDVFINFCGSVAGILWTAVSRRSGAMAIPGPGRTSRLPSTAKRTIDHENACDILNRR